MMRRMHGFESPVGTHTEPPASLAPSLASQPSPASDEWRGVAVGPGRPGARALLRGVHGDTMSGYPIQLAKVQRPVLLKETLARDRLLDWLHVKIHNRVILVLADAGYGKTTLLADFSRRTRLRTLWYRLDEDDRDWVSLLSHLVAAGREHDQEFAPATAAMLSEMAVGGPTFEATLEVFLRELPSIATHGAVLILDDFHLVDESQDARVIARELIAQAPERLSIVFASRRTPTIPLAKMRASGELAELSTDDLRFDVTETARLFRETYGRALEPDVLADVAARTEGWAASLQLVQAALRDRSPAEVKHFVHSLSGADQELYDYLAEEVIGDLPEDLQHFLMCTSILQVVTPDLAEVVTGRDSSEVARLTIAAERLTLLTRPFRRARGPQRYHPLVRGFLEARLSTNSGGAAVKRLHLAAGEALTGTDWKGASFHFGEAGDTTAVMGILNSAMPAIMGSGQHSLAVARLDRSTPAAWSPGLRLMRARLEMQQGDYEAAIQSSDSVLAAVEAASQEGEHALLNLVTMHANAGQSSEVIPTLRRLTESTSSEHLRLIADAVRLMIDAGGEGSNDELMRHLQTMADRQRGVHPHYFGVTMLNLSIVSALQDEPESAIALADEAIVALEETSSRIELSSALMAKATALVMVGRWDEARPIIERALPLGQAEAQLELAELYDSFGSPEKAWPILERFEDSPLITPMDEWSLAVQTSRYFGRRHEHRQAVATMSRLVHGPEVAVPGHRGARLTTLAYLAASAESREAGELADEAFRITRRQAAHRWRRVAELVRAFVSARSDFPRVTKLVGEVAPWNVTFVADLVTRRLDDFQELEWNVVAVAARLHPERWQFVLRHHIDSAPVGAGMNAARLLDIIGDRSDIRRLRIYAGRQRKIPGASSLGRALARRLADLVVVEDQDRIVVHIGQRQIAGASIRRKVLALLCFLLTKPDLSSTREQVLDALWPDLDPLDALNSLNQTVYFLRRVLEENYVDDLSPGYVHHNSDLVWLDGTLVSSRSNDCRWLLKALPIVPTPEQVFELADKYHGRFALDFEYEEWAAPYRDWLHSGFLEVVERGVSEDLESGHFARGIKLARQVLDIDPNAEQVEVTLLRLYRASGAHAAAAEQYAHYANSIRDLLGLEPPTLESL